jgi:hypothetical protein
MEILCHQFLGTMVKTNPNQQKHFLVIFVLRLFILDLSRLMNDEPTPKPITYPLS